MQCLTPVGTGILTRLKADGLEEHGRVSAEWDRQMIEV